MRSRLAAMAVLLVVCYLNFASMLDAGNIAIELPRPWIIGHVFEMFNVFSHYTTTNVGFEAEGHVVQAQAAYDDESTEIDLYRDYFPVQRGHANRMINMHSIYKNKEYTQAAYSSLVAAIKRRHNREHPGQQIDQVRIYKVVWPKSTGGYKYEYPQRRRTLIVSE